MDKVIVPKADLKKLAEARLLLFEILEGDNEKISRITNGVSDVMYKIANTKYPVWFPREKPDQP